MRRVAYSLAVLSLAGALAWLALGSASTEETRAESPQEQEARWEARIAKIGGVEAYEEFALEIEDALPELQHTAAHAFGGALFDVEDSGSLSVCDSRFSFGCFHEFLGRAIAAHGLASVRDLNEGCAQALPTSSLSCQHGIGHGILAALGYADEELEKALAECERLPYNDPIGGCYGGVFMEYNLQTMLGTDARVRRVGDESGAAYEPCVSLAEPFRQACVFWQPQWWHISLFEGKGTEEAFSIMGAYCEGMTESLPTLRRICFEGIGNITAPSADFIPERAAELCDAVSGEAVERLFCRSFAANSLSGGGAGKTGDGAQVCEGLSEESYEYCLAYAENRANILDAGTPPRL